MLSVLVCVTASFHSLSLQLLFKRWGTSTASVSVGFQYVHSLELNCLNTEQKPDETEFLYFFSRQEQPKVMLVFNLDEVKAKLNSFNFIASMEEKIALKLLKV